MSVKRKIFLFVSIIILLASLVFVFGQSLLPASNEVPKSDVVLDVGTTSVDESNKVYNATQGVLDAVFGKGTITRKTIRKLAHVVEYFVVATLFNLVLISAKKYNAKSLFYSLSFGLFIAVIDESLQIISKRCPAIEDVLIDFLGVAIATIAVFLVVIVIKKIKGDKPPNKAIKNNDEE